MLEVSVSEQFKVCMFACVYNKKHMWMADTLDFFCSAQVSPQLASTFFSNQLAAVAFAGFWFVFLFKNYPYLLFTKKDLLDIFK